ncbi:MAG: OmpA family protein, partial [Campylobacterota bacterium]|nr:OmpA family protein [Campylobacterota bacterium]
EYSLGRRSLLDLLSAQNDFIGAKSQIIDAEYDILFAKFRVLNSLGTLVTTIIDKIDAQLTPTQDRFPIDLDRDNDLVSLDNDICRNSLTDTIKDSYGCKFADKNILQIERYSGFLFNKDENNISKETQFQIESLIYQIEPYGLENIEIEILGNAIYDDLSKTELLELSKKRADSIKMMFIKAGLLESNIVIHSNADSSPLELSDNEEKNNRIDIIVKKMKTKR